ncbi:MAG: hypothetical protein ACP5XB_27080 [Isosphaeraceae bacterium]
MAQGKRHRMVPCLESMEDRMVPSAINFSPSVTKQFDRLGDNLRSAGNGIQNYFVSLYQHRPGHAAIPTWTTHRVPTHQTNTGLFGIPWLKF